MAIVENRATEDGDIISIQTDVPIVGIISLTSFSDTTGGEDGSTYFEKTFRYSINAGMTYTDWLELNTANIENIEIEKVNYFIVEYRYKRIGVGTDLSFTDIHLLGTIVPLDYPVFRSMVFNDFFGPNQVEMLGWAINVLEKLYKRGIIPSYITRDNQVKDDSDYISYWFSVTHFFAILVYYAREFENIVSDISLMREFVKGRGIYMKDNPDLDELYYIYYNYITEITKRGTKDISKRDLTTFDIAEGPTYYGGAIGVGLLDIPVDGELLRILNSAVSDENLFAFTVRNDLGWCIGRSSPLYTGADGIDNLIKGYEISSDVLNIDKYPLIHPEFISVVDYKMEITGLLNTQLSGIGVQGVWDASKAIILDPTIDYEISFRIKQTVIGNHLLRFGVSLFNENFIFISAKGSEDGSINNFFLFDVSLSLANTEYWIRGVLRNCNNGITYDDYITTRLGSNLVMPTMTRYLIPEIQVHQDSGVAETDITSIWDVKVRPAGLWFSRGSLSARNCIIGFLKNNSAQYSESQIENIINNELIPYNAYTILKFL
jgi:hypothetical protein